MPWVASPPAKVVGLHLQLGGSKTVAQPGGGIRLPHVESHMNAHRQQGLARKLMDLAHERQSIYFRHFEIRDNQVRMHNRQILKGKPTIVRIVDLMRAGFQ